MSLQGIQLWNSLDQKIQFDQVGIDLTVSIKNVTQCTIYVNSLIWVVVPLWWGLFHYVYRNDRNYIEGYVGDVTCRWSTSFPLKDCEGVMAGPFIRCLWWIILVVTNPNAALMITHPFESLISSTKHHNLKSVKS